MDVDESKDAPMVCRTCWMNFGHYLWPETLGPRGRLPESLSWSSVGSDPAVNCRVDVLRSKLEEPGRRIGQRGDAPRAPTQGPRPGRAAGRRPPASRDWPESDKSIYSSCRHPLDQRARWFSPFPLSRHTMLYA